MVHDDQVPTPALAGIRRSSPGRAAQPGTATENLPAAPFLAAAYAFVWIAAMVYLWSVWRRLNKVEADMHALERKSRTAR